MIGGSKLFSKRNYRRECFNDILLFDPISMNCEEIVPKEYCETRRNH